MAKKPVGPCAKNRSQRGSALIEAALSIPILLTIIAATYELGSVFQQYLIIQQIAYEGARAGSQLSIGPGELTESCYTANTSGSMRTDQAGVNPAIAWLGARVESLLKQQASMLSLSCDDRDNPISGSNPCHVGSNSGLNKCCDVRNINLPSYAGEFIAARPSSHGLGIETVCAYSDSDGEYNRKNGTLGFRISGRYTGKVFPFSIYLTAESRAQVLTSNQDFSTTSIIVTPPGDGGDEGEVDSAGEATP